MEWTADASIGEWLRARIDGPGAAWASTMHGVVPRGYPAYARVFHPATRDRPVGEPWPAVPYSRHAREWDAFHSRAPQIDVERVRWADAADAFDRRMHPLAQWDRLVVDPDQPPGEDGPRDAAGWRYGRPPTGTLDADVVARIASLGAAHTTTPDDVVVGLWPGHGGLVGALGDAPSRALMSAETDPDPRHAKVLGASVRDAFNNVFRRPTWHPGLLTDDVSRGPRLELPGREYILFRASLAEFADEEWPSLVPWSDEVPEWTVSPGLLWPADRAWMSVTEVDWDSSVVAGPTALIAALCADDGIEALPLPEGASLSSTGDVLNG